jgi:Ca2+/Na+ antiporter
MWWKILLIIFAVIFLLLCLNIHIILSYDGEFKIFAGIGLIRLDVLKLVKKITSKKKNEDKDKDEKKEEQEKKKKEKSDGEEKEKKKENVFKEVVELRGVDGVVDLTSEFASLLAKVAYELRKHLVIRKLVVDYNVTGKDAADTALKFGKLSAVFFTNYGIICSLVKVKNREVNFVPDYLGSKSNQKMIIHISYRILSLIAVALSGLKGFMKINSREKSINARIKQKRKIKNIEQAV